MPEKKPHRELGLRMDPELERAMVSSAKKYERSLAQEARYQLKKSYGLLDQPEGEDVGVSA